MIPLQKIHIIAWGLPYVAVPTISRVINQFKGYASKRAGFSMWQARFYEHVIRNEQDYLTTCNYIDTNRDKWAQDEYNNA